MPDVITVNGDPIYVTGEPTEQDARNGRTLAEEVSSLLLFLYFFGLYDQRGRRISEAAVRAEIDALVRVAGSRIERATLQLLNGDISLAVWQARMRNILRAGYTVSGSVARGGIRNMRPEDWLKLGRLSGRQMNYLNRFAAQLSSGTYDKTVKATLARARSYATSIRSIGNQMVLEAEKEAGTKVKRVLTAKESCVDCIAWAAKGYIPAAEMAPIGSLLCGSHCRCYFEVK